MKAVPAILLLLASTGSVAGMPGPPPMPPSHNQDYQFRGHPEECSLLGLEKFWFEVHMKDGRRLEGESDLCRENRDEPMRLRIKGRMIVPEETDSLTALGVSGIPESLGWAFAVRPGKRITAYASSPSRLNAFSHLRKPPEELEPYSEERLEDMVAGHAQAASYMRWKKSGGRIGKIMGFSGLALLLPGVALAMKEKKDEFGATQGYDFDPGPLFFASVGLMAGSWIPWLATAGNHLKALAAYNRSSP